MKMKKLLIFLVVLFLCIQARPQVSVKDSCIFSTMLYATFSYQLPGGDLAKRFGGNSAVGGGFQIKTKKNWLFGAECNYLFGNVVKNQFGILDNIATSDSFLITADGQYADVFFSEQGFAVSLSTGKVIPVFKSNPNSGILIKLQPGFVQHKIKIVNPNNTVPPLRGDYKKGYDELANGFSITEFVGYMHMGNKRLVSFYAGFEFTQAFTKCRRLYNFNTRIRDTEQKFDFFYGLRVGWLIPLYKRAPKGYYF